MVKRGRPAGPFKSLVVLGESTVEGGPWLRNTGERWADILHRLLEEAQEQPLRYHNAGLGASVIAPSSPGYAASNKPSAAERLDGEVIAHKPDLLVIAYGLNDMRAGMRLADFRAELESVIRRVRTKLTPLIVLVAVYHISAYDRYPPFDRGSVAATKRYNARLRSLAKARGCVFADVWAAEGQADHVVHPDTVHANKLGNLLIAHEVFEAIVHAAPGIARNVQRRDAGTEWTRACLGIKKRKT
jgi:lysophospholipase L1-like esterase